MVDSVKKTKKEKKTSSTFYNQYITTGGKGKKLGFSSSMTMVLLNSYMKGVNIGKEGSVGLISYMRTDSTRISAEIVSKIFGLYY